MKCIEYDRHFLPDRPNQEANYAQQSYKVISPYKFYAAVTHAHPSEAKPPYSLLNHPIRTASTEE